MGSSRQKDKNGKRSSSKGDSCDGTSARTRPLSFDEIMLRRKSKEDERDIKNNFIGPDSVSRNEDRPKKTTDCLEPEQHRYESLPSASRHNSENSTKLGPTPAEDNMMADKYARDKHRESGESEIKSKTSMNKDCLVLRRKDQDFVDDYGNETGKRHSRDSSRKERSADKTDGRHEEGRKDKIPSKDGRESYRKRKDMEMPSDALLNEAEKRHSRNHGRIDSYADRTKEKSESRRRKNQTDEERSDALLKEAGKRHSRNHGRTDNYADKNKDKSESGRRKHRSDDEERNDALLNEAEKRHSRNHGHRDSYADRNKEKSESGRRKSAEERNRDKNADRKHSSVKDSEITGREEASRAHLEKERPKRRRSRSREKDRDRDRRSRSGSPRGRKHSSHDLRERGEFSSHSSKDKSGRSHYDLDKKISRNGSDSHSNRHEGSTSGLGGYSPRKRKSEAAAKTPPPTNRSPERKAAWWDLPPVSAGSSVTVSVPSSVMSSMQSAIPNTHQFSSMVPTSSFTTNAVGVSYNYLSSSIHAIDSVQLTQATRPMRRLYVENLPNSASEKDVLDLINNFLMSSGVNRIQGTQPCISCIIHKEKCQALLEFLTPEDASAALTFDGRSFSGSILKIRRPKVFAEVATGVPQKSVVASDGIDNTVEDSPYKIFIGGISRTISSEMLMEIAKTFGPLKAYHFSMNSDLNEPCAFLEYVDHSVTLKACAGLNGMKLGGKVLTVVQAIPDTALLDKDENTPLYRIPQHAKPLLEKHTEVLKLKNVIVEPNLLGTEALLAFIQFLTTKHPWEYAPKVDANVLNFLSETEVEELLEDIRLECARFGSVKSINVVKQSQCSLPSDPAVMDTSCTLNEGNMEFGEEFDRNNPFTRSDDPELEAGGSHLPNSDHHELEVGVSHIPNSDDHELEVGGPHLPNSDEPMETNSAEEAERCADVKTHISEPTKGDSQKAGDDDALAGGNHSDDRHSEELIKGDSSDPLPDDGSISARETDCQENSEATHTDMVSERKDETANPSPLERLEISSESPVKKAIKSDEDNGNVDGPFEPEFSSKEELDAPVELEKKKENSILEMFDPDCVLVEFRRAEAACMAAHCLHGRLFDDRIVTVEYVPLDLYQTKFAKQN